MAPALTHAHKITNKRRQEQLTNAVAAVHAHCAVYTRPDVAAAILDRIGWTENADLRGRRLLEPACGDGAFLLPAVERLLQSARTHGACSETELIDAIVAFEFEPLTAQHLRLRLGQQLTEFGLPPKVAARIASRWLRCEDFLLAPDLGLFSDVVGNPPYMRWSKVPTLLRTSYEKHLPTYAARGDICLAFICRAVELLRTDDGRVAFLCADRWLRCAYGSAARVELERVARLAFHLEVHDVPVFVGTKRIGAYAAISILERTLHGAAVIAHASSLEDLRRRLKPGAGIASASRAARLQGSQGAILVGADLAAAFARMVETGTVLANAGIEVRCGMALGCASVFVIEGETDVEEDRLVPWARTPDLLLNGKVEPSARVINVWTEEGTLIKLSSFPRLKAHLASHRADLQKRVCVVRAGHWYRTIDRLDPLRVSSPKILVAGMARFARVALSRGAVQPSNAVYAVTTNSEWPLAALFALFRCGALDIFAAVLAPRFSGGTKRFDGNVLRQVRIPLWSQVDPVLKKHLLDLDVRFPTSRPDLLADIYKITSASHRKALATAVARPAVNENGG